MSSTSYTRRGYRASRKLRFLALAVVPCALLCSGLVFYIHGVSSHTVAYAQTSVTQKDILANQAEADALNAKTPPSSSGSGSAANANAKTADPVSSQPASSLQKVTPQPTIAAPVAAAPVSVNNPGPAIASLPLYTDPTTNASVQASALAISNPATASVMNRLAATPVADWFGNWSGDITSATNAYVSNAAAAGALPVLVAYNIPNRDCGGYSSGGAVSAAAYQAWISSFAAGIGQRNAVVILEPDALAGMDCLSSSDQQSRLQLLTYAVQTLRGQTKAAIYLDAGNPTWQTASTMASRLKSADLAEATGFSLNVSNFQTTASNIAYGTQISKLTSGRHFIIDTSRNGNGPATGANNWCNPDGRAFGNLPSLQTGNNLVDAYLWVKNPAESDGNCGLNQQGTIAPNAGGWWPQYAQMLAQNSNW